MKNKILYLFVFCLGFITHAFFFPDMWYDGLRYFQKQSPIASKPTPAPIQPTENTPFITYITYENQTFDKRNVIIHLGNYVAITNMQKDAGMWLDSDNPSLSTPRPYSYYERIQTRLDSKGIYHVSDKLNPKATITILVK